VAVSEQEEQSHGREKEKVSFHDSCSSGVWVLATEPSPPPIDTQMEDGFLSEPSPHHPVDLTYGEHQASSIEHPSTNLRMEHLQLHWTLGDRSALRLVY